MVERGISCVPEQVLLTFGANHAFDLVIRHLTEPDDTVLAAERHGATIVECDSFADILPSMSPRLAALDGLRRVISIGTFSKTLSASLRVGYVAAAPSLIEALNDLKMLTVVSTSGFAERFVAQLINGGHYRRHLRRLRGRIDVATAMALQNLAAAGWPYL